MKHFIVLLLVVSSAILISCGSKKQEGEIIKFQTMEKEYQMEKQQLADNKEIALGLSKAIMTGNWAKVNELIADDFKYEADGRPSIGKNEYIGFMKGVLCTAMKDMDMQFLHVVAEGDLVSVNYTNKMTHVGTFFGIPATNNQVIGTGQFIREIKNGQVTAEWQTTNSMGLMQQLGAFPAK